MGYDARMKRWTVLAVVVVALSLTFVFSAWAYQAHQSRITNNCDPGGLCAAP
jgi:peroxiredoxin